MCFRDHGVRRRRCGTRAAAAPAVGLLAAVAAIAAPPIASAAPLDEPFVGGLSFSGPTSGNLAAIYWNPAALGLVRGFQLMVGGSFRHATTDVTRGADPTATARDFSHPASWPLGPGGFIGLSSDIGGDRFVLGFATYLPYVERVHYPVSAAGPLPTRYHALAMDLRNLALVPALAIRFGNDFRIGLAPGFLFSTGRLVFDEDLALHSPDLDCGGTACEPGNAAAAARYDITSGHGFGASKFAVTLGVGVYFRRRSFEVGFAYQSRPLGADVDNVEVAGHHTTITLPSRDPVGGGLPLTCANGQSARCVFGDISYRLPDIFIGGVTWRLVPGLELTAMARWLRLHTHDRIDVRLVGPTLDAHGIPTHVSLYRGFKDVWDTRVRVSYWWRETVRVGAALRLETSAVPIGAVNAAAVDGLKLQPLGLLEVRIGRKLWLGGGYGITFMRQANVSSSAFNPTFATDCTASGGDLDQCREQLAGRGRASAEGRYARTVHDFGFTVTARF